MVVQLGHAPADVTEAQRVARIRAIGAVEALLDREFLRLPLQLNLEWRHASILRMIERSFANLKMSKRTCPVNNDVSSPSLRSYFRNLVRCAIQKLRLQVL